MAATTGSILVEMKKNRTSWVFSTGRSDTANAAGVPRTSTRIVEIAVAPSEFARYGPMPASNTARNCSSVGVKNRVGGSV